MKFGKIKRSQEEIAGFVMIILLVSIIFLVILGIMIRKPKEMSKDENVKSFLTALLRYTTECEARANENYNFADLIKACLNNENCMNNETACFILNKTSYELIGLGFKTSKESESKAYSFKIFNGNNSLINLSKGNFTGNKKGEELPVSIARENWYLRLEVYY